MKRKKLFSNPGLVTRPTTDRLRETIFNIISGSVREARVLDLYAGTGALGIEALSRGALNCFFIDSQKKAVAIIGKNIEACSLAGCSKVITWDIVKNLNCLKGREEKFDLVFMDPPYDCNTVNRTLNNLHDSGALAEEADLIIEHVPAEPVTETPFFQITDYRTYGKTTVTFLKYTG